MFQPRATCRVPVSWTPHASRQRDPLYSQVVIPNQNRVFFYINYYYYFKKKVRCLAHFKSLNYIFLNNDFKDISPKITSFFLILNNLKVIYNK